MVEDLHMNNEGWLLNSIIRLKRRVDQNKRNEILDRYFESDIRRCLSSCDDINVEKQVMLFCGNIVDFDKGTCQYLKMLDGKMLDEQIAVLSESVINDNSKLKGLPIINVPKFFGRYKEQYQLRTNVVCSRRIKSIVKKNEALMWAYKNITCACPNMEKEYALAAVFYAYEYLTAVLDKFKPIQVILWNEFFSFHHILKYACHSSGIKIFYMEFGSLPGTFSIERFGQMGKSYPAIYYKIFRELEVSDDEIEQANLIIHNLKESGVNRNEQPNNNAIEMIADRLAERKPTILYAGINDFESGVVPYSEESKIWHSPMFKDSEDALWFLRTLSQKNGWNLIYKPHPLLEELVDETDKRFKGVTIIKNANINEVVDLADVVVTILSQVSYISLVRSKPVVMLGYTQLKGKGCTYEAFSKAEIEDTIKNAAMYGYSEEIRDSFVKHIAQMLKYNLYDDMLPRNYRYGRTVEDAVKYINQ